MRDMRYRVPPEVAPKRFSYLVKDSEVHTDYFCGK